MRVFTEKTVLFIWKYMNSTNGTFLNGRRLFAKGTAAFI